MKMDTEKLIIDKAKSKKDGCYRLHGIAYRVRNNRVTHFADYGEILERCYGFNVIIGKYKCSINSDEVGQKLLKQIS